MNHTIAIADDHLLIAKALSGIIESFQNFEVLYEVENGKVLQKRFMVEKNIPDIVLLDISMPVMDGFATATWLRDQHPQVLVIALSMQDDDESLIKMIRAGARGYLHKNVHPTELKKALESIISRGMYYPDWAASKVFSAIAGSNNKPDKNIRFSDRETEFLQYAATELTYKEIGDKMFCSPRTVESYRDTLFEKTGLRTRVGLVVFAIRHGIFKV